MACSTGNQKFLVSVGKAMAFDTACSGGKQLVFVADTLMNSTITQAIQSSQVYGGPGSRLLFEYDYQKEITVTLEDAAFSPTYLAIQNGSKLSEKLLNEVYVRQLVTFGADGTATLENAPNGDVQVALPDGTFTTVLPMGQNIAVAELAGTEAQVVYRTNKTTRKLTIDSSSFPNALELVLTIDIFDSNNKKVEEMQIIIPKFKPDGNFEMSLTHDGVATSSMTGKAMDSCDKYAEIHFIEVAQDSTCQVTGLIAIPSPVELDFDEPTSTVALSVRQQFSDGSIGAPLDNTGLTFVSSDDAVATVDASGVVSMTAGAIEGDTATITVTDADARSVTVPVTVV